MPQQLARERLPTLCRTRCKRLHAMIPGDTFVSERAPFNSERCWRWVSRNGPRPSFVITAMIVGETKG
jgi:hypothetical protein